MGTGDTSGRHHCTPQQLQPKQKSAGRCKVVRDKKDLRISVTDHQRKREVWCWLVVAHRWAMTLSACSTHCHAVPLSKARSETSHVLVAKPLTYSLPPTLVLMSFLWVNDAAMTSSQTRGEHQAALIPFSGRAVNFFAMSASASSSKLDVIAVACHALHPTHEPVPHVVLRDEAELLFERIIQRQLLCADGQINGMLPAITRASRWTSRCQVAQNINVCLSRQL